MKGFQKEGKQNSNFELGILKVFEYSILNRWKQIPLLSSHESLETKK